MKKILFCATMLALVVGCSDNETDSLSKQDDNNKKGISFESVMTEDPATRGEIRPDGDAYNFFWYAEQDRIKIWSKNTLLGDPTGSQTDLTDWDENECAIYKATQSKSQGQFTAISDDNWLNFCDNDEDAHFFMVYPSSVETTGITNKKIKLDLPDLTEQCQTGCEGQSIMGKHIFAYSLTTAKSAHDYNSVGETVNFRLTRPFTAAVFRTIGVDSYCDEGIFGNLKEITLEMCGNEDKGFASSNINYGDDACYIFDLEKCEGELEEGNDNCTNKITLKLGENGEGLHWNDKDRAYMAINCVTREGIEERMEVTYEFENITLVDKDRCKTSNDWPTVKNGFVTIPALDISDYTYLVTNGNSEGKDRTLIINKDCELSEIYDKDGKVIWEGADDGCVPVENFCEIIANDKLSSKLLASLGDFTKTQKITLKENTKIPACTFEELEDLEYINMPKVTEIESGAFCETAELKTVLLCSYDFCDDNLVHQEFIKNCLVKLDMSAVTDMSPAFPAAGFTLAGFEDLEEVIVNDEIGITLGASSFQGCISLEKVTGKVNLEKKSVSAFEDCMSLKEIELVCDYISNYAFSGCECLENIICSKLTYIETAAFKGTALKELDLCDAEFIGEGAFEDCKELEGIKAKDGKNRNVLYVGGEYIAKDAFKDCKSLVYVHFEKAKSFGSDILCGADNLKEVKFSEIFKAKSGVSYSEDTFGPCNNVKLFVHPDQDCWSGRTLELNNRRLEFGGIIPEK